MPTFDFPSLSIALCFVCVSTALHLLFLRPEGHAGDGVRQLVLALLLCGISLPMLAMREELGLGFSGGVILPTLMLIGGMSSTAFSIFLMLEISFSKMVLRAMMVLWMLAYLAAALLSGRAELRYLVFNLMAVLFFGLCAVLLKRGTDSDFGQARNLLKWLMWLASATFAIRQFLGFLFPYTGQFDSGLINAVSIFPMLVVVSSSALVLEMITGTKMRRQIMDLASRDELTGLLNRKGLRWQLTSTPESRKAVAQINVDHFSRINDRHGHMVGDQILVEIGGRVRMVTRHGDIAARMGGDEFVIVAPVAVPDFEVHEWAERIRRILAAEPFMVKGGPLNVEFSVGCSVSSPEEKFADVYRRADQALHHAKKTGRNRTVASDSKP
jgi:diguanylate cyclase (GGDEF)-like protein